jgi:lipoprotein signal peptidase
MYELSTAILATVRKINETSWAIMFDARNSGIAFSCLDGAARITNLGPAIPW